MSNSEARREPTLAGKRVLLVADPASPWTELVTPLEQDGIRFEVVGADAVASAAPAAAARDDTVAIVDFSGDAARGMAAVTTFRRLAERVPVIAVAQNPPLDLVRRVRMASVFYLALDPVSVDELRTVLHDAYECLARGSVRPSELRSRPAVLLIDDDADFRASTRALLEAEGYAVSCARDGKEGLVKIKSEAPNLIVLDVMMEHGSAGYEVNWAVKFGGDFEEARHVPILMVSSVQVDPTDLFGMAAEAAMVTPDCYLTKPLDIPRFLDSVRSLTTSPADLAGRA